ncbi:uncharacterized protein LOC135684274 isoform X2 [Rhopilema esculentum]|uniref:uncharacterized protein LOC135684274 isoform X2 n=1 Tax=Rhopilema esculentum TaxID=499914 RepID=UPI0031D61948
MALSLDETDKLIQLRKHLQCIKASICKRCKKNFELEREVRFFDQKIALLINHRISLQEFPDRMSFGHHRAGVLKDDLQRQHFGNLFFLLQSKPEYMAQLARIVLPNEIDELLKIVMFSLYGNQYEAREEHLLLRMFEIAIKMELHETDDFNNLLRANTAISRMMTTYTRRGPGQEYLKATLGDLIQDFSANHLLSLDANPSKIYAEVRGLENENYAIPIEEALQDPEVSKIYTMRINEIKNISSKFLDAIINSLHCVPYGIRWLCKAIMQLPEKKFQNIAPETVTCLIGGFFMLRFINPAIVSPHAHMLLTCQPRPKVRRNLVMVAKILQAMSNKLTGGPSLKEDYLRPLESFVVEGQQKLQVFLRSLCDVVDFHSYLEIEQYLSLPKDTYITITVREMYRMYELLYIYKERLYLEEDDKLQAILEDIGQPMPSPPMGQDFSVELPIFSRWNKASDLKNECPGLEQTIERGVPALRKRCRKILITLFLALPALFQEKTLVSVLKKAETHEDLEIRRLYGLAASHLDALKDMDSKYAEEEFLCSVKEKLLQQELQYDKLNMELKSLESVYETLCWHGDFLSEQLEAYKEYLADVRHKAVFMDEPLAFRPKQLQQKRTPTAPLKFSFLTLEKEGLILESRNVPEKRKNNIYFTVVSTQPGIYKIGLHYRVPLPGEGPKLDTIELNLEDLLELQHLRDPVLNLHDYVLLDARQTLAFLYKNFSFKQS